MGLDLFRDIQRVEPTGPASPADLCWRDGWERPQHLRARLALLGEAKATVARRGTGDLQRPEHIRTLLAGQGQDATGTTLALFSPHGFHPALIESAAGRDDLLLVDLATLYGIEWPPSSSA